ncbi:hypothetical protein KR084_005021, partial [Drosophila pseudotakahashii]
PSVSFAEITRYRVLLGLIDRGNPENRISKNKWKAVESQLSLICLRMVRENPGSSPCCMDAGWYQGSVKVVACDNQRSADPYKQATAKLGAVYEGANIVALDWCDVPSRPRARIWLPAAITAPEDILFMLQECNPHLPTKDWKVVKVEEHAGDVNQAIVVLNKESVAPIDAARGVLNYGFSAVHIKIYKGDSSSTGSPASNPAEQVLAEEAEAPGVPEDGYSTDSTGTDSTSRTASHKLAEKNFPDHFCSRRATNGVAGNKSCFHPQGREGHPYCSEGFQTDKSDAQHAYTKGKSTESVLHLVVSNIEKSLSIQEYTLIAFLDIEEAFNNVLPTAITESLTELGV